MNEDLTLVTFFASLLKQVLVDAFTLEDDITFNSTVERVKVNLGYAAEHVLLTTKALLDSLNLLSCDLLGDVGAISIGQDKDVIEA